MLIVPFDSLEKVVSKKFFWLPVKYLLLDKWDNVAALKDYQGPIEIYGARDDEVIPVRHARSLAEQLPRARFVELPGGHNDWSRASNLRFVAD